MVDEVIENMREAIPFHREGMRLHGDLLLDPMSIVTKLQAAS
jgi:predicted RNase H-like HicB family nuclease